MRLYVYANMLLARGYRFAKMRSTPLDASKH